MTRTDISTGGELVASYRDYSSAQRAVDQLSDSRFPVENVVISGSDLRLIETVVGRLSYGRAAVLGLSAGAWFGLLIGIFVSLFSDSGTAALTIILWGLVWGAIAGMLFALISYAFTRGERDFLSRKQIVAAHYDVLVRSEHAAEARRLLGISE